MKKGFALILALVVCLSLTACGGSTSEKSKDSGNATKTTDNSNLSFHDNVYETDALRIEITRCEVIPAGDTTYNQYNFEKQPVMAFWYTVTNKSGDDITPMNAWIFNFKAIQDNDPNSVNELRVSSLPDQTFLDSQTQKIKKGGTVECCCGYVLDDDVTPVTLIASDILGTESGRQNFPVK